MTHADYIRLRHARRDRIPGEVVQWQPSFLPNLIFWLDASKITGVSDGETISIWKDQSLQQNDAVMTTGSMQPTFALNNGIPVVRFDGTNDYLETINNMPGGSGTISIYVVFYPTDRTNRSLLGWGSQIQYQFMGINLPLTAGNFTWIWWSYDATVSTLPAIQNNTWYYLSVIYSVNLSYSPPGSRYYRELRGNGSSVNFDPFASPHIRETTAGKAKIGLAASTNVPWIGDIAEILVYDPAPDNNSIDGMIETFQIEHYFRVKYGLP